MSMFENKNLKYTLKLCSVEKNGEEKEKKR